MQLECSPCRIDRPLRECATPETQPYRASGCSDLTHYCIVRADLPRGIQAAQLIHAAGQSSPGRLAPGTYAVALTVQDEESLRGLADTLARSGLPHHLVVENDAPYSGQLMALGLEPALRNSLRRHLHKLPLLS